MTPFWIAVCIVGAGMAVAIIGVFVMALCAMASYSERESAIMRDTQDDNP